MKVQMSFWSRSFILILIIFGATDVKAEGTPNQIAENIVLRIAQSRETPEGFTSLNLHNQNSSAELKMGSFAINIPLQDREIHIYRGVSRIDQVVDHGFLNVHQTGTSSFYPSVDRRTKAEDAFAQSNLGDTALSRRIRPKYGVLNILSNINFGIVHNSAEQELGPIVAVLKNSVLNRSTYTSNDSLLMYDGTPGSTPGANLASDLRPLSEPTMYVKTPTSYVEAQIWGDVTLDDVKEWRIGRIPNPVVRARVIKILERSGLPIYEGEARKENNRISRQRGELISTGSSLRRVSTAHERALDAVLLGRARQQELVRSLETLTSPEAAQFRQQNASEIVEALYLVLTHKDINQTSAMVIEAFSQLQKLLEPNLADRFFSELIQRIPDLKTLDGIFATDVGRAQFPRYRQSLRTQVGHYLAREIIKDHDVLSEEYLREIAFDSVERSFANFPEIYQSFRIGFRCSRVFAR